MRYFNRTDVQQAINALVGNWDECLEIDVFINGTDNSPPSGVSVLSGVTERSKRTVIGHGIIVEADYVPLILWKAFDMVLISNGTLLMIQNMT
jgi:carboxypeptidase D